MKRFLTTTALVLSMSTVAHADNHGNMDWSAPTEVTEGQFYGSDLIGMRVYRSETEHDPEENVSADARQEWDDIGEINDLIITKDGNVQSVILGIGGFLGVGERDVAISMDAIHVLRESDDADDRFLVVKATKEELGMVPEYDREQNMTEAKANMEEAEQEAEANMEAAEQEAEATMEKAEENVEQAGAEAEATAEQAAENTEEMVEETQAEMAENPDAVAPAFERPMMEREGYAEVEMVTAKSMSADDLQGARVYGINDEDLGEISELLLENDELTKAVIDVGGFLGLGEKPVAVDFNSLQILKNNDSGDLRIYLDATEESLEQQPEYEG